jgi:hypothetical protein
VLNGGIYAVWGLYDVWRGLDDADAGQLFNEMVDTLAANIHRWDLGYWSRYDLYRHPGFINVASSSYHALHINQLSALNQMAARPELARAAERFKRYAASRINPRRAFVHKGLFRLVVPRNHVLAARLPWLHREHVRQGTQATDGSAP